MPGCPRAARYGRAFSQAVVGRAGDCARWRSHWPCFAHRRARTVAWPASGWTCRTRHGAVIGPHRGRRARRRSLLGSSIPFAVPYTVSCDNGCSASVAPVDDPVQHTLGNLPGCACGTFLPDASSARAAVRRCSFAATATAGRFTALRVAPRRRADSRNATPAGATRTAGPGASITPREPGAGASAKRRRPCPYRCRQRPRWRPRRRNR